MGKGGGWDGGEGEEVAAIFTSICVLGNFGRKNINFDEPKKLISRKTAL